MDKSKPEVKPSDTKRHHHGREFKIATVRQLEEGKINGIQLALIWKKELGDAWARRLISRKRQDAQRRNLRCQTAFLSEPLK